MAYPHKWSPISCKSSAGQRKHIGQRPMLYRWTTQPFQAYREALIVLVSHAYGALMSWDGVCDTSVLWIHVRTLCGIFAHGWIVRRPRSLHTKMHSDIRTASSRLSIRKIHWFICGSTMPHVFDAVCPDASMVSVNCPSYAIRCKDTKYSRT